MGDSSSDFSQVESSNGQNSQAPPSPVSDLYEKGPTKDHIKEQAKGQEKSSSTGRIQLQLIDENQKFSSQLTHYMNEVWHLGDVGFGYNMVAVFGSQSTGKSTLLNTLFGTSFDTMGDSYRQQTTRGLWISLAEFSNTLVMDVEGVDGRERGEDQDFERKSALFSLAVSQVVLINLWENQVGLYNGANMGLLKTVFEVNLELFQKKGKSKTLLFFVIRDHLGKVSLSNLSQTLKQDLQKTWGELTKPKGLEGCAITDFFDFMFFGLPHRVLLPEEFEEQASVLAQCFYDSSHPNYVFRPQYHKRIPADGLQHFTENMWNQIVTDKSLDLPTQQQLLAQFRCDEIAALLFETATETFQPFLVTIEDGELVGNLGKVFRDIKETALSKFDEQAGRYHPEVYQKKRLGLQNKIDDYLHAYFKTQLACLSRKTLEHFNSTLKERMSQTSYDFNSLMKKAYDDASKQFKEAASDLVLPGSSWSFVKEEKEFHLELKTQMAARRHQELAKFEGKLAVVVLDRLEEELPPLLNSPQSGMWEDVLNLFSGVAAEVSLSMQDQAEAFELDPSEIQSRVADVRVRAWEVLIRKIKEEVASDAMLLSKLRQRLEENFRYDADGLPRVWKPEDDIDAHFKLGKSQALELLPLLSRIDISKDPVGFDCFFSDATRHLDFKKTLTLASPGKLADLETRFKRESDALYLEAKRSIVATTAKVPYWVLGLLLVLGWNEIIYVFSSPFMVMFGILGAAGLYSIYSLNLMGPMANIFDTIGNEIYRQVALALDDSAEKHLHPVTAKEQPQKSSHTEPAIELINLSREEGSSRNTDSLSRAPLAHSMTSQHSEAPFIPGGGANFDD